MFEVKFIVLLSGIRFYLLIFFLCLLYDVNDYWLDCYM